MKVDQSDQQAAVHAAVADRQQEGGVAVRGQGDRGQVGGWAQGDPSQHQVGEHGRPAGAVPEIQVCTVKLLLAVKEILLTPIINLKILADNNFPRVFPYNIPLIQNLFLPWYAGIE